MRYFDPNIMESMQSVDSRRVKVSITVKRSQWPGLNEGRNVNDLHEAGIIQVVYVLYDGLVEGRDNA